ncbi:unnamed protein product [Urochloa humidicola]
MAFWGWLWRLGFRCCWCRCARVVVDVLIICPAGRRRLRHRGAPAHWISFPAQPAALPCRHTLRHWPKRLHCWAYVAPDPSLYRRSSPEIPTAAATPSNPRQ